MVSCSRLAENQRMRPREYPIIAALASGVAARLASIATLVLGLGLCAATHANDAAPPNEIAPPNSPFSFSGYGTLGRSWDDHADLVPIRDISQRPEDNEFTGPTWLLDTRIGVQFAYRPSAEWEGIVQMVARDQEEQTLDSVTELAYLGLLATPETKLRLGRMGPDVFLMSDHRNLGYAYPWVRPPREFYGWIPIYSVDGIDLAHDFRQGDAQWRVKAQLGNSAFTMPMGMETYAFETDSLWGLSLTRQLAPWQLKFGLASFIIGSEGASLAPLHQGLEQLAAAGVPGISSEANSLRREASFLGARVDYFTAGVAYDDGIWLGQAEFSYTRANHAMVPQGYAAYLAAGYRRGDWTPYVMLSASRPSKDLLVPQNDWDLVGQQAFQDVAYRVVNSTRVDQETLALGVRWDFDDQAAVKLQLEHSRIHPWGYTLWFRPLDILDNDERVNQLSLSLDFVF